MKSSDPATPPPPKFGTCTWSERIFSKIDLNAGYHQLSLAEESRHLPIVDYADALCEFVSGADDMGSLPTISTPDLGFFVRS